MEKIKILSGILGILAISCETFATLQLPPPPPPPASSTTTTSASALQLPPPPPASSTTTISASASALQLPPPPPSATSTSARVSNDGAIRFLPPPLQPNIDTDPEIYFQKNPIAAAKTIKENRKREKTAQNIIQEVIDNISPTLDQSELLAPDTVIETFEASLDQFIQQKSDGEKYRIKYTEEFIKKISEQPVGMEILKKIHESYVRKFASTYNTYQILQKLTSIKEAMKEEIDSLTKKSAPTDKEINTILTRGDDFIVQIPGNYAMAYITEYIFSAEGKKSMVNQISSLSMENEYRINLTYLYAFVRSEVIKRSVSSDIPKFLKYRGILQSNHKELAKLLEEDLR